MRRDWRVAAWVRQFLYATPKLHTLHADTAAGVVPPRKFLTQVAVK